MGETYRENESVRTLLLCLRPVAVLAMPGKSLTKFDQWNMWSMIYRWTFAHGYVRIPLTIAGAFAFQKTVDAFYDEQFKLWNKGTLQADVWRGIEKRAKERAPAASEEEEE
jgi:hypothetical protein